MRRKSTLNQAKGEPAQLSHPHPTRPGKTHGRVRSSRFPCSADYNSRFECANQLRKAGDADGAIRILRELVAAFPEQAAAYLIIGDILWDEGSLSAAAKEFRVATKRFPELEIASLGLFHTLWQESKTDAAFDEVKRFQSISFSQEYKGIIDDILHEDFKDNETHST